MPPPTLCSACCWPRPCTPVPSWPSKALTTPKTPLCTAAENGHVCRAAGRNSSAHFSDGNSGGVRWVEIGGHQRQDGRTTRPCCDVAAGRPAGTRSRRRGEANLCSHLWLMKGQRACLVMGVAGISKTRSTAICRRRASRNTGRPWLGACWRACPPCLCRWAQDAATVPRQLVTIDSGVDCARDSARFFTDSRCSSTRPRWRPGLDAAARPGAEIRRERKPAAHPTGQADGVNDSGRTRQAGTADGSCRRSRQARIVRHDVAASQDEHATREPSSCMLRWTHPI